MLLTSRADCSTVTAVNVFAAPHRLAPLSLRRRREGGLASLRPLGCNQLPQFLRRKRTAPGSAKYACAQRIQTAECQLLSSVRSESLATVPATNFMTSLRPIAYSLKKRAARRQCHLLIPKLGHRELSGDFCVRDLPVPFCGSGWRSL